MKRLFVALTVAAGVVLTGTPALADAGEPGTNFPGQPGTKVAVCATVTSGIQVGGGATNNDTSDTITEGLLVDACFGG